MLIVPREDSYLGHIVVRNLTKNGIFLLEYVKSEKKLRPLYKKDCPRKVVMETPMRKSIKIHHYTKYPKTVKLQDWVVVLLSLAQLVLANA
ncbi:hypothetical protein MTR_7g056443 [Medicago truncatula]|uniref:Uncharacterized protein n=1 Tax=Medicago truncatula TaxID=3880 RepID=A0A072TYV0_MEDTR|nr:hypothetical protein MTR_7g056443 [Medicago truncatula]